MNSLDFFNFNKPCPSNIKDCEELRKLYLSTKNKINASNCTYCSINDLNVLFLNHIKSYKQINKIKKILSPKYNFNTSENNFKIKKFIYKNRIINEQVIFGKKYIVIINQKNKTSKRVKILLKLSFFNYSFFICCSNYSLVLNAFTFTFFFINRKNNKLLFYYA